MFNKKIICVWKDWQWNCQNHVIIIVKGECFNIDNTRLDWQWNCQNHG